MSRREAIAVVGFGCRLPGGVDSPESYWALLREGRDGVVEVPPDRWDVDAYYDPDPNAFGKIYARRGGFVTTPIDRFDASFFGISPKEAWPIDPAHRLLLEVTWEALEDACIPPDSLFGTNTGIFIGLSSSDYIFEQMRRGSSKHLSAYHGSGVPGSFGSGRISHFLGTTGPSVTIDTACSTSMVTTLEAAKSLWSGRCDVALSGGAHVLLSPDPTMVLCRLGALSKVGLCRAFDAEADGYVRAEGAGTLVLKRLSDAQADGDRIHALILGGAINHDGRSSSLTVPRLEAQQAVIEAALADACLDASQVGYVEAHGTGTPVGDPIEATAIGETLCRGRPASDPLLMASGKTNIGHLEIGSGVAAIIKVALSLRHREIPPHLHLNTLNPHVDWARFALEIPRELVPWEVRDGRRIAGLSSFGLSGTNAHLLMEEAPTPVSSTELAELPVQILPVSGRNDVSVRDLAERYSKALALDGVAPSDFCYTARAGRTHHRRRIAVVGSTGQELAEALGRRASAAVSTASNRPEDRRGIAFLCTGQGAQYPGMGRGLFEASPQFRAVLEDCAEILRDDLEIPLLDVIFPQGADDSLIHQTEYTQPALFSLEMALAAVWKSWGIEPSHVMGHSLGEFVAATLAGVFRMEDALHMVAARGRLMHERIESGSMAVVFADENRVLEAIQEYAASVSLGAVNGPQNTVISGAHGDIDAILARLEEEDIQHRRLTVSHAFHSPMMDPMLDPFEEVAKGIALEEPDLLLVSNVTGKLAESGEVSTAQYWRRQVRSPVRFGESMRVLRDDGVDVFVEIGPHPTLLGMGRLTLPDDRVAWIPSLRRGQDDYRQMAEAVGALYEWGVNPDWEGMARGQAGRPVRIPTYAFQGKRHWFEAAPDAGGEADGSLPVRVSDANLHPLLGTRLRSPAISGAVYQVLLESDDPRYLRNYRIGRMVFAPAGALLEMVRAGAEHGLRWEAFDLRDVTMTQPLGLPRKEGRVCQVVLGDPKNEVARFEILSAAHSGSGKPRWTIHMTGEVHRVRAPKHAATGSSGPGALSAARERCSGALDSEALYGEWAARGMNLGAAFRSVTQAWVGDQEVLARVDTPDAVAHEALRYGVHPVLLDSLFHTIGPLSSRGGSAGEGLLVPTHVGALSIGARAGSLAWVHAQLADYASGTASGEHRASESRLLEITGYDDNGKVVLQAERVSAAFVPKSAFSRVISEDEWSYVIEWRNSPTPPPATPQKGRWIVLDDASDLGPLVAAALDDGGATVVYCGADAGGGSQGCVDYSDRRWTDRAFGEAGLEAGEAPEGIVCLWGLDSDAEADALDARILDRAVDLCTRTTDLIRALEGRSGLAGGLTFVTRGASGATASARSDRLAPAGLWGLVPVIRSEHPEMRCKIIDLDPETEPHTVSGLVAEIAHADDEDRVAYLGKQRRLPRLTRYQEDGPRREGPFRKDSAYLVTGGLGGIGLAAAEWLSARGAGAVMLNSRRSPDVETQAWADSLRERGTRVEFASGDVSQAADVERMMDWLRAEGLVLRGVFHLAGVLDDGLVRDMTEERYRKAMAPKVAGALNLHLATANHALDHFVLFSSMASFMGSPAQGNYAAANAILGALAELRTRQGFPALSVDWGPWAESGMAARLGDRERQVMEGRGLEFLDPPRAFEVLEDLLHEPTPRTAVMAVDWPRMSEAFRGMVPPPFLSDFVDPAPELTEDDSGAAEVRRRELQQLPSETLLGHLLAYVSGQMAGVLGVSVDQIAPDVDVREAGFDSLMALELRYKVESDLGISIPVSSLMEGLSPNRMALVLRDLLATAAEEVAGEAAESAYVEGEI